MNIVTMKNFNGSILTRMRSALSHAHKHVRVITRNSWTVNVRHVLKRTRATVGVRHVIACVLCLFVLKLCSRRLRFTYAHYKVVV